MAHGGFDLFERHAGNFSRGRPDKAGGVKRAELKAKKNRVHWQAAILGRDTDVGRVVARDVFALGADDDRHEQREAIDGIGGND